MSAWTPRHVSLSTASRNFWLRHTGSSWQDALARQHDSILVFEDDIDVSISEALLSIPLPLRALTRS